jgi:purine-binding chemotaxis protein CheW
LPGRRIDWDEVHAQLDRAESAAREALRPSAERTREVLDGRARALARIPARVPDAAEVLEVATFSLDDERYAIETRHVRRVARLGGLVPIPGAPAALAGVINSGGEILAVFDLRVLFGKAGKGPAEQTHVIVLGGDRDELGIVTDDVHEVLSLGIGEVLDSPVAPEGLGRHAVRGVTERALIVLDGAALLLDDRLVIDQGDDRIA